MAKHNPLAFKSLKVVNLAVGGTTHAEAYFALKDYLQHNDRPKFVVISYTPDHWENMGELWRRSIKFDFLTFSETVSLYRLARHNSPNLFQNFNRNHPNLSRILSWFGFQTNEFYLKYPKISTLIDKLDIHNYWAEISNGTKQKRRKWTSNVYNNVIKERGHVFYGKSNGITKAFGDSRYRNFRPSAIHISFTKQIQDLLGNDSKLVYIEAPVNRITATPNRQNYAKELAKRLSVLGLTVINPLWVVPDSYFGDPSHIYKGSDDCSWQLEKSLLLLQSQVTEKVTVR